MKRKRYKEHSSLSQHKKVGSQMVAPFRSLGIDMKPVEWFRDLLPEYLWLAGLAEYFGIENVHQPFALFLDALDKYVDGDTLLVGHLSDFELVKVEQREKFLAENKQLVHDLFFVAIGRILTIYPSSPASWLLHDDFFVRSPRIDPGVELNHLRKLVNRLYTPKDDYTGHLRSLPLSRSLKHGKVFFPVDFRFADVLPRYPIECTDDEKSQVQSFARNLTNMHYQTTEHYKDRRWAKYFWRHNFEISICRPANIATRNARPMSMDEASKVSRILQQNREFLRSYIEGLHTRVKIDLYDPIRDEIHFGLISRIVRLYCLVAEDSNLWARDTSGIILRSLVDCAISICYLIKSGSDSEYRKFRDYGEGQEKLLFLHLQDNYTDLRSLEGMNAEELAENLGGFEIETLNIELGNWTSKDTRKLAIEAGMEKYYRLVYSPSSAELHGAWHSLKGTSLCRCVEPLHRFHRLATFYDPPAYVNTFMMAQDIVKFVMDVEAKSLGYPDVSKEIQGYQDLNDESNT